MTLRELVDEFEEQGIHVVVQRKNVEWEDAPRPQIAFLTLDCTAHIRDSRVAEEAYDNAMEGLDE